MGSPAWTLILMAFTSRSFFTTFISAFSVSVRPPSLARGLRGTSQHSRQSVGAQVLSARVAFTASSNSAGLVFVQETRSLEHDWDATSIRSSLPAERFLMLQFCADLRALPVLLVISALFGCEDACGVSADADWCLSEAASSGRMRTAEATPTRSPRLAIETSDRSSKKLVANSAPPAPSPPAASIPARGCHCHGHPAHPRH
mmetsp:Transcript_92903/g.184422  ORF Transcript_92903/g.184422 Transcript_92903/m.184422 type:complete len:202 (+) Transcript_92903:1139-1744(+)